MMMAHDGGLQPTLALVMARALLSAPITAPSIKPAVAAPAAAGQAAASAAASAVQPSAAPGVELAFEPANGPLRALWLRGPLGQLRVPVDAQATVLVPSANLPGLPAPPGLPARQAARSAAWMVLRMQPPQPLTRHMGVDGGGGNVGMAQQQLHGAQISAVVQQVGGKRMAQGVR